MVLQIDSLRNKRRTRVPDIRGYLRTGSPYLRSVLIFAFVVTSTVVALSIRIDSARGATSYNWPEFDEPDWSALHTGVNNAESTISAGNVSSLTQLFQVKLPAVADGSPIYLSNVSTASGTRNLVFVTTKDGRILALDANTGATVWSHQYGPNGCVATNGGTCYTTSSPAIDPDLQYVYSYGLDGYVHKYAVGTGTEITGSAGRSW